MLRDLLWLCRPRSSKWLGGRRRNFCSQPYLLLPAQDEHSAIHWLADLKVKILEFSATIFSIQLAIQLIYRICAILSIQGFVKVRQQARRIHLTMNLGERHSLQSIFLK